MGLLWMVVTIVPAIGVLVHRLHETTRSGWWSLSGPVPVVGAIVLLVFTVADSTEGEKAYGPSPKVSPQTP